MFTGIVQGMKPIVDAKHQENFSQITVDLEELSSDLKIGASVSINGVCLTVTHLEGSHASFDIIEETLKLTTLGSLAVDDHVNIERACRVGDEIGGHHVAGHVDFTTTIIDAETSPNNVKLWFHCPNTWLEYLVPKGWVAVDGISLTLVDVDSEQERFSVCLIPETLRVTSLGVKATNDVVHIEIDSHAKLLKTLMKRYSS